jgi:hypothetical protein
MRFGVCFELSQKTRAMPTLVFSSFLVKQGVCARARGETVCQRCEAGRIVGSTVGVHTSPVIFFQVPCGRAGSSGGLSSIATMS